MAQLSIPIPDEQISSAVMEVVKKHNTSSVSSKESHHVPSLSTKKIGGKVPG